MRQKGGNRFMLLVTGCVVSRWALLNAGISKLLPLLNARIVKTFQIPVQTKNKKPKQVNVPAFLYSCL